VPQLPLACQPGINAARLLYAGIGREVERAGFDSVSRRAVVPAAKKAQLLTRAVIMTGAAAAVARGEAILPLEQTRFLVDAVNCRVPPARLARIDQRSSGLAASTARAFQWWNLDDRAGWLLALFERLERDDEVRSQ
jgi:phytoene synthase